MSFPFLPSSKERVVKKAINRFFPSSVKVEVRSVPFVCFPFVTSPPTQLLPSVSRSSFGKDREWITPFQLHSFAAISFSDEFNKFPFLHRIEGKGNKHVGLHSTFFRQSNGDGFHQQSAGGQVIFHDLNTPRHESQRWQTFEAFVHLRFTTPDKPEGTLKWYSDENPMSPIGEGGLGSL